ncbi:MAG: universal stress protein [Gemmatimonadales bacterium]
MRSIRPFRSILVPLDGSPFAEQALPLALAIGRAARSKVRLVLVHQLPAIPLSVEAARFYTSMELAVRRSERGYLRGLAARLRQPGGPRVVSALLAGPVADILTHYVRDSETDLVVMSTHGRGPLQRAWLGSVADYLIRNLEVPVLLVRPREEASVPAGPPGIGRIMVPLDGSPLAEAALVPAAALARLVGAEVVLLQVVPPLIVDIAPLGPRPIGYHEEIIAFRRSVAHDYLQGLAEQLGQQGLRAIALAVLGPGVAETILDVARRERIDLLAVATRGQGGIRRLTLGSVADKLVRAAEAPVLVIRPTKVSRRAR